MTTPRATLNADGRTLSVTVPLRLARRGGRKAILAPDGTPLAPAPSRVDDTLLRALARAFRWKRMLETGEFTTIAELAGHEGIAPSYMTRVLRLTLLAPDIVEAILDGRQGVDVTLAALMKGVAVGWGEQRQVLL